MAVNDFNDNINILCATKEGLVKQLLLKDLEVSRYSKSIRYMKVTNGDEVVSVDVITGEDSEVVIATNDGYMNRYDAKEISII